MLKKLSVLLVVAMLATLTVGVTSAQDDLTICFGFQDLETEFWVAGYNAITQTLAEQGVTVLEYNANEDPNRQLEQIRECIAQGVDGIIIIPQDGDSAVTIINEAQSNDVQKRFLTDLMKTTALADLKHFVGAEKIRTDRVASTPAPNASAR